MRAALVLACLAAAVKVSAQGTTAPAKPDAKQDTKQGATAPASKAPVANAPVTKTPATQVTKAAANQATKAPPDTKQAAKPAVTQAPPAPVVPMTPVIMRETFAYDAETRRDPFVSLLTSAELRPTVVDLRLTGILYDETGRNSIATMRDMQTDVMYRVKTGQIIGRMRVALIKRGVVIFSIEEFGLNRQDSLVLGDTTKKVAK